MKIISLFFISILAFNGSNILAQEESYTLTLDQALEYALQHNKTLLNARGQVASSIEKTREARAQGLPQVNGSLDFMTYFNYKLNFSFGGSDGGTGGPPLTFDETDENNLYQAIAGMFGPSEPIIMNNQLNGVVQVSQLIFSGQFWVGMQATMIAQDLSRQNVIRSEQDVKEGVTNTYYLILVSEKNLKILEENFQNLSATLRHTENMFKSGVAEATDVDQLKISLSQLKNTQKAIERGIQMSYNMLKFQLGVAPDTQITLSEDITKILDQINPSETLDPTFDITRNINFSMVESQVKFGEKQLGMQNWSYSPSIAGFYSYTKKIITTGFDLSPNHLAGFSVTVPIFSSGMRHARVSQAKIDLDIAMRNRELVKDQLETQKNQLMFNYQNALENYETQKENVEIAGRVYKNIHNKYDQGMVSSLELTLANNNLLNAESNYLSSILTLLQAQTSLDKLFNKI